MVVSVPPEMRGLSESNPGIGSLPGVAEPVVTVVFACDPAVDPETIV